MDPCVFASSTSARELWTEGLLKASLKWVLDELLREIASVRPNGEVRVGRARRGMRRASASLFAGGVYRRRRGKMKRSKRNRVWGKWRRNDGDSWAPVALLSRGREKKRKNSQPPPISTSRQWGVSGSLSSSLLFLFCLQPTQQSGESVAMGSTG